MQGSGPDEDVVHSYFRSRTRAEAFTIQVTELIPRPLTIYPYPD